MSRTNSSISINEKSGLGISLMILVGMFVLMGTLLYGVYRYFSEGIGPEYRAEQQANTGPIGLATEKSDKSSSVPSDFGDMTSMRSEPEPADPIEGDSRTVKESPGLPALDQSDKVIRGFLAGLSDRPEFLQWIASDQLIRKITMLTDNLAGGAIPAARIRHLAPEGQFSAIEKGPDLYVMDPKGYHRYDIYSEVLASLDIASGIRIYQTLKPLFDEAYRELGYPEGDFDVALRQAIIHLLQTPVLSGEIELSRPSVTYRFADPELESLSSAQKQLIRMGPKNARAIQAVLRSFLNRLDQINSQSPEGDAPG